MRFGLLYANVGAFARPTAALTLARAAEAAGFESLWTVEHTVVPAGYTSVYPYSPKGRMPGPEESPIPDPLVWLAYVAAATTTIKLGTGILILPQRNPVLLAKETGTLASLSGGRLLLGVGAGWLAEEFDALGVPFAERGRRLDDHIGALRALWGQSPAGYDGAFSSFRDLYCEPRPESGAVPIVIGGHTPVAARRAGRLGDGFMPGTAQPGKVRELFAIARQAAVDAGRDPDALELTAFPDRSLLTDPVAAVDACREMGISRLVISPPSNDPATVGDLLARFGQDVIATVS